jgi:hypothetical protein
MAGDSVPVAYDTGAPMDAMDILVAQDADHFCHDLIYLTRRIHTDLAPAAWLLAVQRCIALMALTHARQSAPTVALSVDAIRAAYGWMTYRARRVPPPAEAALGAILTSLAQDGLIARTATGRWQRAPLRPLARTPAGRALPPPRRQRRRRR